MCRVQRTGQARRKYSTEYFRVCHKRAGVAIEDVLFFFKKHLLESTLTFDDGGLAGGIRRFFLNLLQVALPFGNSKHP